MAMMLAAGGASGKRRRRRKSVMSEINVTPMVDVMLVLLIIFMVAAPLLTVNIQVDLPKAAGGTASNADTAPLELTVKKTSGGNCVSKVDVYLGDTGGDHRERGIFRGSDRLEARHDAPDRAEQADKGAG